MYALFSSELRMVDVAELNYNYDDFKLLEIQIYDMESTEKEISIKAAIKVSCIFYRHTDSGEILDGSDKKKNYCCV